MGLLIGKPKLSRIFTIYRCIPKAKPDKTTPSGMSCGKGEQSHQSADYFLMLVRITQTPII